MYIYTPATQMVNTSWADNPALFCTKLLGSFQGVQCQQQTCPHCYAGDVALQTEWSDLNSDLDKNQSAENWVKSLEMGRCQGLVLTVIILQVGCLVSSSPGETRDVPAEDPHLREVEVSIAS